MSTPEVVLVYLDIIVASFVVLGIMKTAYNGVLRDTYIKLRVYDSLPEELGEIEERQVQLVDAVIAIAEAHANEDAELRPEAVRERLDRADRLRTFLRDAEDQDRGEQLEEELRD